MATSATPGRLSSVVMSPIANTSGWPGQREVGQHRDATGPVELGAARLGELGGERRGLHAGRPDRGVGVDPRLACRRRSATSTPTASTPTTRAPIRSSTPSSLELLGGRARQAVAERGERLLAAVEQDDADRRRIERAELALEATDRELADLSRPARPRRAGADDRRSSASARCSTGSVALLGHLEGAEDPPAQLEGVVDRLHARARSGPARRARSTTALAPAATMRLS